MDKDYKVLETLAVIARDQEQHANAKLAAAIVIKGKVIAYGHNSLKTDPLQARFGKNKDSIYLHAEIHAIKNALRQFKGDESKLKGATMYVARVKGLNNEIGMSCPCVGCSNALKHFGFKKSIYTIENNKYGTNVIED